MEEINKKLQIVAENKKRSLIMLNHCVKRFKIRYRNKCADLVLECLGSRKPRIFKIINMFRFKIVIVQKTIRNWIKLFHLRRNILLSKYELLEQSILSPNLMNEASSKDLSNENRRSSLMYFLNIL